MRIFLHILRIYSPTLLLLVLYWGAWTSSPMAMSSEQAEQDAQHARRSFTDVETAEKITETTQTMPSDAPSPPPKKRRRTKTLTQPEPNHQAAPETSRVPLFWARQNWLSIAALQFGSFYRRPEFVCDCGARKWTGQALAPLFYDVFCSATSHLIEDEEAIDFWDLKVLAHAQELGLYAGKAIPLPIVQRLETFFLKVVNHTLEPEDKIERKEALFEAMYYMALAYVPRSQQEEIAFLSITAGRPMTPDFMVQPSENTSYTPAGTHPSETS